MVEGPNYRTTTDLTYDLYELTLMLLGKRSEIGWDGFSWRRAIYFVSGGDDGGWSVVGDGVSVSIVRTRCEVQYLSYSLYLVHHDNPVANEKR